MATENDDLQIDKLKDIRVFKTARDLCNDKKGEEVLSFALCYTCINDKFN